MDILIELISKKDDESYKKAAEVAVLIGVEAFGSLKKEYQRNSDPQIRAKIVKIAGSIEDSSVVMFLESALDDPDFEVRRAAALSLKILTDQDYYERIYKSDIGKSFHRNFWCSVDFVDDAVSSTIAEENYEVEKDFARFFKKLSSKWSYSQPGNSQFFTFRRKSNLDMAEDGRVLYKNFNYSLDRILEAGKNLIYLTESLVEVLDANIKEKAEKEDILRCIRLTIGSQLRKLEEGLGGFMAAFHFIRFEFNLALPEKKSQMLPNLQDVLSSDEVKILDKLSSGFSKYFELRTADDIDGERVSRQLVILMRHINEFIAICKKFQGEIELNHETYKIVKQLGYIAGHIGIHNLSLLSYWCKEE